MIEVSCAVLRPGVKLAKAVYNPDGLLLIKPGERVQRGNIDQLKRHQIDRVFMDWPDHGFPESVQVVKEDTRRRAAEFISESMSITYRQQIIEIERLQEQVAVILEEILDNEQALLNLTSMRSIDEYSFGHSINVCILSLVMGMMIELEPEALRQLGLGAMVHDIGKVFIDADILNKPGPLEPEEYEQVKKHTLLGVSEIKNYNQLSKPVREIIRHHHEWANGSGYPDRLKNEEIPVMAKIVSICDVYDSLTSDRVYKERIQPQEALEYLLSMSGRQFDDYLLKRFFSCIRLYPSGMCVFLSTGEKAEILSNNPHWPTRPVVKILANTAGEPVENLQIVDLSQKYGIEIM